MTKFKKKAAYRKSSEERKEQVDLLLKTLENGVRNFEYDPEKFKAILLMQSLMPNYSFNNIMLIMSQKPNASFVAPFSRWKELNRNVRKGEKAIRILAPRFIREIDEDTEEKKDRLIGFIGVPVFDLSQTEGDPLPIDKVKLELTGESDEARNIFQWVQQLAEEDNCQFSIAFANGAYGYYMPSKHAIVIDEGLTVNHRAKTAVHELVHSRVHRHCAPGTSKEEQESVAEGTAFIVCSYFGLDTSDYSFEYIRGWSSDDGKSLLKYGEIIQQAANKLISDFERVAETTEQYVVS